MKEKIEQIILDASNGDMSLLDATIELNKIKKELEGNLKLIKEFTDENIEKIVSEASVYNYEYNGFEIKKRAGGIMYDFSVVPEIKDYEKELKAKKDFYKSMAEIKLKGGMPVTADGELIETLPEIKYRKSSLIIKPIK